MKNKDIVKLLLVIFSITLTGCSSTKGNHKEEKDYTIYVPTRSVKNNHPIGKLDLYIGARNYFTIIPNDKNLKLDISMHNGIIEKHKHSEHGYNIYSKNYKRSYLLVKYGTKLDTVSFYKKVIPAPILRYRTRSINTLSSKELKDRFNGFMATLMDFNYDCVFKVHSMDLIIIHNEDKSAESYENLDNNSPMLKKLMRQAKPNDTYIFNNVKIKVVDTEDVIIRGESIISKIVE